jgi:hypothetical protein
MRIDRSRLLRRRFLTRLGLASTAPLLHGIANSLLSEAFAAGPGRRVLLFVIGETWHVKGNATPIPPGVDPGRVDEKYGVNKFGALDMTGVQMPSYFKPLAPFRNKIAIVDGLFTNFGAGGSGLQHGTGYGLLSGLATDGPSEYGGKPKGITLDQYLARRMGKDAAVPSLLVGMQGGSVPDQSATTFAAGANQPLSHVGKPSLLQARLLGPKATSSTPGGDANEALLRKRLLDSMRDDIKRLQGELAGEEKTRLDGYLGAIDQYDRKQQQLRAAQASVDCSKPPTPNDGSAEARLESMFKMLTLALRCGLTQVAGVSIGHGFAHDDLALFKEVVPGGKYGSHGPDDVYGPSMSKIHELASRLVADLLTGLGPLADQTVVMMIPGSGVNIGTHHANIDRWGALVYDGTNTLRTGSRYLRFGLRQKSTNDLLRTVALAAGVTATDFAADAPKMPNKGPIAELVR